MKNLSNFRGLNLTASNYRYLSGLNFSPDTIRRIAENLSRQNDAAEEVLRPKKLEGRSLENFNRKKAAEGLINYFSREERYLKILARDLSCHLSAFSANNFKSEGKREQKRVDFFYDFQTLREKMSEYRWSKEFLAENGIDLSSLRKLYFRLFSREEIAAWS